MFRDITNATLTSRLKGIEDAQNRARLAFFILTYATGAVLFSLWNEYLSWERQWSFISKAPKEWGKTQVLVEEIRSWVESQSIGVSLLGLHVSVSDVCVLGAFVLFILSYYYCMCARRENHEIGGLLVDTMGESIEVKEHVFTNIRSGMVVNPASSNDTPYLKLNEIRKETRILFSRAIQIILAFLPPMAIIIALGTDLYFAFFYESPWRDNTNAVWTTLELPYKYQLIMMDFFGLVMLIATTVFCFNCVRYNTATRTIFNEYCEAAERK